MSWSDKKTDPTDLLYRLVSSPLSFFPFAPLLSPTSPSFFYIITIYPFSLLPSFLLSSQFFSSCLFSLRNLFYFVSESPSLSPSFSLFFFFSSVPCQSLFLLSFFISPLSRFFFFFPVLKWQEEPVPPFSFLVFSFFFRWSPSSPSFPSLPLSSFVLCLSLSDSLFLSEPLPPPSQELYSLYLTLLLSSLLFSVRFLWSFLVSLFPSLFFLSFPVSRTLSSSLKSYTSVFRSLFVLRSLCLRVSLLNFPF